MEIMPSLRIGWLNGWLLLGLLGLTEGIFFLLSPKQVVARFFDRSGWSQRQAYFTLAKVAREMVEKSGINVDQLLELLVKNASAELTTYYYYTILRANLIGLEGEGLKEIAETARIEDRNHFEALVPRIYELGGKLPESMLDFHDVSACPPAVLPKYTTDVKAILTVLVEAERCAVRRYTHICNLTVGKDHRTCDLALAILNEEI